MTGYTVAVRDKGKSGPFRFVSPDLKVHDTANRCTPLPEEAAKVLKQLFRKRSKDAGRLVECRIVRVRI